VPVPGTAGGRHCGRVGQREWNICSNDLRGHRVNC